MGERVFLNTCAVHEEHVFFCFLYIQDVVYIIFLISFLFGQDLW